MKKTILSMMILGYLWMPCSTLASENLTQQELAGIQQQTSEMSAVGVPEAQARKMVTQMVQNHFQNQSTLQAQQVVMATARAGLPTEPVMNKAMEGMAKKASARQVIAAMQAVQNRYAHAHQTARNMGLKNTAAMTQTIADCMAAGMQVKDIDAVAVQLQVQTRNLQQTRNKNELQELAIQAMQVARTMARMGYHSPDVSAAIGQALQNQFTHQEMQQLQQKVAQQRSHASALQVTSQFAASIGKGGAGSGSGSGGSGSGSGGSGNGSGGSGNGSGGGGNGSGGGGNGSGGGGNGSGGGGNGSGGGR